MNKCASSIIAALCLAAPTGAAAISLGDLTDSGSFTVGDVTFSGFGFSGVYYPDDPPDIPIPASAFDVSGSWSGDTVTLTYRIDPAIAVPAEESQESEFESAFTATLNPDSTRSFTSIAIGMTDFSRIRDSYIEFGANTPFLSLDVSKDEMIVSDMAALASASAVDFEFSSQAGAFEAVASATLREFTITLGLDSAYTPPPSDVPLPASLLMLLGGVGALGFAARRRRAAQN